ncbi:unnamed protein product [Linum trigynum]|uniref:Uncharacterized protein n=1 Tax=Linum trigynum TaxID=586398 RepID=A0AAV2GA29_9ROSI
MMEAMHKLIASSTKEKATSTLFPRQHSTADVSTEEKLKGVMADKEFAKSNELSGAGHGAGDGGINRDEANNEGSIVVIGLEWRALAINGEAADEAKATEQGSKRIREFCFHRAAPTAT